MRIGIGYDVHRLAEGRPLVLGGVSIPWPVGLIGHSDADVLVHAACDALLGAAGLGDIGDHFPDNSDRYKDIYSIHLLEQCVQMLQARQFTILNLDATILAQAPKLMPYREVMKETMARAMRISTDCINIKASTTEGLGAIGRGEGMAAQCVVLIDSTS
jgi:2-C-methyl-D-erythritol 2,4-cyclodiphosphate synthase